MKKVLGKPVKKVKAIYFEDINPLRRKRHPWENGLIFMLEDGTRLRMNSCENMCLVPFNQEEYL